MAFNPQTKVLIYGNIEDYRSRLLVKILVSQCKVALVYPGFFSKDAGFSKFIGLAIQFVELFIKTPFADVIYLPAMNARYIKSATLAASLFNKKLVSEMYISIYDTYVKDRKLLKGKAVIENSRQAADMLKKDQLALTKSDYLIHTANHELDYWAKLLSVEIDRRKILIAPNCNISSTLTKKETQNKVINICWWGTFIPLHGLDNILQALRILQNQKIQFTCNLFGIDNPLFAQYAEKIRLENLTQVNLRKDLSFANGSLPNYLVNHCDLALGIFGNTDKADNTIPNKLIEALSMGLPTLTMNSPALTEFFNPKTDLWTCQASPESIADSIIAIASGSAYPVDWKQTRQKVLETFSVARYQEVINQVLERATNGLPEDSVRHFRQLTQ